MKTMKLWYVSMSKPSTSICEPVEPYALLQCNLFCTHSLSFFYDLSHRIVYALFASDAQIFALH